MLTWNQIEANLTKAGASAQAIANTRQAHAKQCAIAAMKAKQQRLIDEYEEYRRARLLDYFEELADRQVRRRGV